MVIPETSRMVSTHQMIEEALEMWPLKRTPQPMDEGQRERDRSDTELVGIGE